MITLFFIGIAFFVAIGLILYASYSNFLVVRKHNQKQSFAHALPPNTEVVFEVGGRRFYRYINELEIPVQRALCASDFYTELEQKVEKDYLEVLFEAVLECINANKITDVVILVKEAKSRLTHITHLGLMYKLASVVYIEEGENPETFDIVFAEKKIAFWQEHAKDVDAFFLQMPIGAYIPYLQELGQSLQSYSQMQAMDIKQTYEHLSQAISGTKSESALKEKLQKLIEQNDLLANFVNEPSTNTL
jgi:hypothetical protein